MRNDLFIVFTILRKSNLKHCASLSAFKMFKLTKQKTVSFHVIFIGYMIQNFCMLLLISYMVILLDGYTQIKSKFHQVNNSTHNINVTSRYQQIILVKISVNKVIMPYQKFHNCKFPARLAEAKTNMLQRTF